MPRVIKTISNNEYHAHPAVSKSILDKIAKSPLHCRAYLDGLRTEPTAAMQFGTAVHSAVLEPEQFDNEYAVFEGDRRTTIGKQTYADLLARGKTIITASDYDVITSMTAAIRTHPVAASLLRDGRAEQSVFWVDKETGLECKCRPDWWRADGVVVDVKTTEDASPAGFAKSMATFRYHLQAAFYMEGTGANEFLFIAVEKKPPYAVAVYGLDDKALEEGRKMARSLLDTYAFCDAIGSWHGYSDRIEKLSLPRWAYEQEENAQLA